MAIKILLTKPGKEVTDQDLLLDDYYLHSDYPLLKVHASGTFSIDSPNGSVLKEVTHNLGYYPYVMVFSEFVNLDGSVSTDEYFQHDWDILLAAEIYGNTEIKTDVINIRVGGPVNGDETVEGFYYIFKEEIG